MPFPLSPLLYLSLSTTPLLPTPCNRTVPSVTVKKQQIPQQPLEISSPFVSIFVFSRVLSFGVDFFPGSLFCSFDLYLLCSYTRTVRLISYLFESLPPLKPLNLCVCE
ncbi:hypothetical protein FRC18_010765 [Serendipita sp. 400]|nr:hypothetical protein FRC18_010765 [Serendipita sp. 400]